MKPLPPLQLTIEDFPGGTGTVEIYLFQPSPGNTQAFALTPIGSSAVHSVGIRSWQLQNNRLDAEIDFTMQPDPWTSISAGSLEAMKLTLTGNGSELNGFYEVRHEGIVKEGKVRGQWVREMDFSKDQAELVLTLTDLPLAGISKAWQRRAILSLSTQDGVVTGGSIRTTGSATYSEWSGYISRHQLKIEDGLLHGNLVLAYHEKGGYKGHLDISLRAWVIGGLVAGSFLAAEPATHSQFQTVVGRIQPGTRGNWDVPSLVVVLHGFLPEGHGSALRLYLQAEPDGSMHGFGFSPTDSRATHVMERAMVWREDDYILLDLDLTLTRDPFQMSLPPERKSHAQVRLHPDGMHAAGEFESWIEGNPGSGYAEARLVDSYTPGPSHTMWVKLEDGLLGGEAWENRAFANLEIVAGTVVGGKFHTNKHVWQGALHGGTIELHDGRMRGKLDTEILSGSVTKGSYKLQLEGSYIGEILAGRFVAIHEDGTRKEGPFVGGLDP